MDKKVNLEYKKFSDSRSFKLALKLIVNEFDKNKEIIKYYDPQIDGLVIKGYEKI